ncbi:MAG: hypothetical protein H6890_00495 [Brucellaceae bacterium]|nr:hypothetical protein [Brucellaceae bacterium]
MDMFAEQDDLFPNEPVVYRPDAEMVRRKLRDILEQARAASSMPWDHARVRYYQQVFPQMTNWLPVEEASQFVFQFEQEMERLKAA